MAEPWTFKIIDPLDQIFEFSNGHVTFAVDTQFEPTTPPALPESVTVESVSLTILQNSTEIDLGITNVEIPPPVIAHLAPHFFDLG
jgi:hypothetical protein